MGQRRLQNTQLDATRATDVLSMARRWLENWACHNRSETYTQSTLLGKRDWQTSDTGRLNIRTRQR